MRRGSVSRFMVASVVAPFAVVAVLYVAVHAAGTPWAVPVALCAVGVAFLSDWLSERRPSSLSALQRFERRERRRAA